jgi:integrase
MAPKTTGKSLPSYRFHKARNCAVVTIDGRNHYLGEWQSPASLERYARLIAEWKSGRLASPSRHVDAVTVGTVCLRFMQHAESYYVKAGEQTSEVDRIRSALRHTCRLWASLPATEFSPLKLKQVQSQMVDSNLSRKTINEMMGCIRRCFRWAVAEELIPGSVLHGLAAVAGLRAGRSHARETAPIRPVEDAVVTETMKHAGPIINAMVTLQLLTGMRPAEVCSMRPCDITFDLTGAASYRPARHKTEHHGQERIVFIGPRGLEILRPFLDRDPESPCFSPAEAVAQHRQQRSDARQTPRYRSHMARNEAKRKTAKRREPGTMFTPASYRRAVQRACERAFPCPAGATATQRREWRDRHDWAPNRLRHSFATTARAAAGLDAVAAALGHADIETTKIYAEKNADAARALLLKIG